MADITEIKLNAAGGPGPAKGDIPKLHHLVEVQKLLAARFFDGSPYLAPSFGQHVYLNVVVFQFDHFPIAIYPFQAISVKSVVRVYLSLVFIDKKRNGVGIVERVGR